jgi:hypothetical protein
MSEWFYINLAYGLTWVTLAGYAAYLTRRGTAARAAWRRADLEKGGQR